MFYGKWIFLITGTSRGIGEALANKALDEGNTVLGISRKPSGSIDASNYHHLAFDLAETSRLGQIMEQVDKIVGAQDFDFICLVNNASLVEPLGSIENCPTDEIEAHIHTGLISPMVLTSLFIGRFKGQEMRKKIAFISSGSAFHAMPDLSTYCSSKAGITMFAQCVGLEQKDQQGGFEVLSIDPGMVDTAMQQTSRSKTRAEYAMAGFFKDAFENGRLQDPEEVAEEIYAILE